jgi:glycerophosphoryl diester phosphodiesterase
MKSRYFLPPKPRFLGHRGAAGHAPENTLLSFEIGAKHTTYLETDAWLTRDGVPVFLHDESLLRTCGVDKKIGDLTLKELQDIDAGHTFSLDDQTYPFRAQGLQVPTVESILKKFPDKHFNIELKDSHPEAAAKLLEAIKACDAEDRVLLAAEHDEIMQRVRRIKPAHIPTSGSYGEIYTFLMWLMKGAQGPYASAAQAFQIPHAWQEHDLGKPEIIGALHTMGLEVHYWTINDPKLAKKLLDAGADGIVTDRPEMAADFSL